MLKNNNQNVVKRLTRRLVKGNRTRNIFAVIAIILTTYMISTIFSVGLSFSKNYNTMTNRLAGTLASITLEQPTQEQTEKIKELGTVKSAGLSVLVGETENGGNAFTYSDETDFQKNRTPCIDDIKGSYPKAENEIMMSLEALKNMGITTPEIGMELPEVTFLNAKSGERITESFRLSGYFTDYTAVAGGGSVNYISKALMESLGYTVGDGSLMISSKTGMQTKTYETIEKNLLQDGQSISAGFDTSKEKMQSTVGAASIIVLMVLFIVLSGYLLIYNVIYISVTKDTRFFGLLKTIGVSPKQIKKIVRNQIYFLSIIGIPIGIGLAILTSFAIVPYALNALVDGMAMKQAMPTELSFNPFIFIGTAFFALLTIALSSRKPAKLAAKISPVEAMNYIGQVQSKNRKDRHTTKGSKPHKMAWYNVFREKKRAVLVFTSLFMGTITFLSVNTFLNSLKMENYIGRYAPYDFQLQNIPPLSEDFSDDFIEKLRKIDGMGDMDIQTMDTIHLKGNDAFATMCRYYYDEMLSKEEGAPATYEAFLQSLNETPDATQTALIGSHSRHIAEFNKEYKTEIDKAAYEQGEICFLGQSFYMDADTAKQMIGKKITVVNPKTGKEKTLTVAGIMSYEDIEHSEVISYSGMPFGIIVNPSVANEVFSRAQTSLITIDNVAPEKEPAVKAQIERLTGELGHSSYILQATSDTAARFDNTMKSFSVLSAGVSVLLITIGLINFINVMLTGVYIRRKELAVLESVGMTKKQISRMLTFEGLYYALITSGLILTLGNLVLWFFKENITSIADYAVFQYPYAIIAGVLAAIFAVCLIVPRIVFRTLSKESVTERLHENQE